MLDLPTFLLIIGVGNLSFAGLMAAYARGPIAQPALATWMWARVTLGLCQLASVVNLQLQSAVLAQVIAMGWFAGMALEVGAYCLFFRFAFWRRILYPATALAIVTVAIMQVSGASLAQMIPIIAVVVALFAGAMGSILVWPRDAAPGLQRVIGMNDLVLSVAVLAWVASGVRYGDIPTGGGAAIQSFAFIAGYILMIVKGFGFLLLCKKEDDCKMLRLATIDSLTGLFNRHAFFEQAQALRARAVHTGILMLDMDHFKRINDRFGHATGDDALRLFAQTVQAVLAGRGVVGRLGGEEFAIALAAPLDDALQLAEQLRSAIHATPLVTGAESCLLTVSIGVAVLHADEALAGGLARADQALYDAKHRGRNRVEPCRTPLPPADPGRVRVRHVESGRTECGERRQVYA